MNCRHSNINLYYIKVICFHKAYQKAKTYKLYNNKNETQTEKYFQNESLLRF